MKRKICTFIFMLFLLNSIWCKKYSVYIWSGIKSMRGERVLMEVNVPENPNGTAVIICPGGSYHHLGIFNEGRTSAKWFNSNGVTTCLLWYRVAKNNYHYPAQMQDIQRAIQLVRENPYFYKANKIGVIGFSAGGHLAAWSGMFGGRTNELKKIGIETSANLTPDFVIPVYPVVSMQDDIGHKWSRKSLLGKNPSQQKKDLFSLELQVPKDMPPTYLVACRDDPVVLFENSVRLSKALEEAGADFVFKQYPEGGHGFGMVKNKFLKKYRWNEELKEWLLAKGFM
ncbi:MAG: alpha/beta hydrolase [Treponema sp.]|nr:alpha/beta hydrolase [Treponema sp.]